MKYSRKKKYTDTLAIFLSLAVHALLLLGASYLPAYHEYKNLSKAHTIKLDLQAFNEAANQTSKKDGAKKVEPIYKKEGKPVTEQAISINQPDNLPTKKPQQASSIKAGKANNTKTTKAKQDTSALDNRGLYKIAENKKTGASLEFVGWTWDFVPNPKDDTSEVGKIVFEIIIDDSGEIIAIQTLEKTVSPIVEQLYKDEITKLTFSKTNQNMTYAPTSTGKITFILEYK